LGANIIKRMRVELRYTKQIGRIEIKKTINKREPA
tara:strand:- start:817 stop:921 length:105 start_codon:yes stop_codon:yes gene_type:complete